MNTNNLHHAQHFRIQCILPALCEDGPFCIALFMTFDRRPCTQKCLGLCMILFVRCSNHWLSPSETNEYPYYAPTFLDLARLAPPKLYKIFEVPRKRLYNRIKGILPKKDLLLRSKVPETANAGSNSDSDDEEIPYVGINWVIRTRKDNKDVDKVVVYFEKLY
ncbi:hypothetical protein GE21DRAFT_1272159 [Neurospora crassa]|nr:hypothetical protein GE21DRAFT_1272159 [Neurospora crassa]